MIARYVGKGGYSETNVLDAFERERVGADLDGDRSRAIVPHRGENRVQLRRQRRGIAQLPPPRTELRADSADDAARYSSRIENRRNHSRRRRFAVRSGDADRIEVMRGVAIKCCGENGERPLGIRNSNNGGALGGHYARV